MVCLILNWTELDLLDFQLQYWVKHEALRYRMLITHE